MIAAALTEMFGLKHSIILGSMGGVSGGALAAAVSNAGGLGLVGGGYGDPAWLRTKLSRVQQATQHPWGAGLITWAANPGVLDLVLSYRPQAVMLSFGDPRRYASAIEAAGCTYLPGAGPGRSEAGAGSEGRPDRRRGERLRARVPHQRGGGGATTPRRQTHSPRSRLCTLSKDALR